MTCIPYWQMHFFYRICSSFSGLYFASHSCGAVALGSPCLPHGGMLIELLPWTCPLT